MNSGPVTPISGQKSESKVKVVVRSRPILASENGWNAKSGLRKDYGGIYPLQVTFVLVQFLLRSYCMFQLNDVIWQTVLHELCRISFVRL